MSMKTSRPGRASTRILALAIGAVALAGCAPDSGSAEEPSGERLAGSFVELLEQDLEQADNPFVIEVLTEAVETGGITQAQYDEAHRRYTECMVNAGYEEEYARLASGLIKVTPVDLGEAEMDSYIRTVVECSAELAPIEGLYNVQQGNPDLLADNDEVVVACLKRSQLVDASYTTSDFLNDFDDMFENAPYDPNDPAAQECFSAGGYAIGIGER